MNDYQTMITTLESHGVGYKLENGKLYADNVYTLFGDEVHEWEDVSEFITSQLLAWLGYTDSEIKVFGGR